MLDYFKLQLKRNQRILQDFGINPLLGFILIGLVFIGFTYLIFSRVPTNYTLPIYLVLTFSLLLKLSNSKGKEFVKMSFTKPEYRKLRVLENSLTSIPFIIGLLVFNEWLGILILSGISILLSFFEATNSVSISFKTPFSNQPFEFSRGFRKNFWVYFLSYGLSIISVSVGNDNLGLFSVLLLGLTCSHFYSFAEPDFFVWVHRFGAKNMLQRKIKISLIQLFFSVLPILVMQLIVFPTIAMYIGLAFLVTCFFMVSNLLLKYAHYPRNIELIQIVMWPVFLIIPPIMLLVIPFYYGKARDQLNTLTQ